MKKIITFFMALIGLMPLMAQETLDYNLGVTTPCNTVPNPTHEVTQMADGVKVSSTQRRIRSVIGTQRKYHFE